MKQVALWLVAVLLGGFVATALGAAPSGTPKPKVIALEAAGKDYPPLLQGPPESVNTEHDVMNTGTGTLRYVYVVSKAAN